MAELRSDPPRGLLNWDGLHERVRLNRYVPSPPLDFFVEHYWTIEWNLQGQPPFTSVSLPYPSVHLVLQDDRWHVTGVQTGRFTRTLTGVGAVFGIKFRPGGFRPFVSEPVTNLTNAEFNAVDILPFARHLPREITSTTLTDVAAVLAEHLPDPDPCVPRVTSLVEIVATERGIVRVEQLGERAQLNARGLQRLFREYVGVSPKWVIQRYRLFEAANRLVAGEVDLARVAHELGYFDQAHFNRDFKAMVGRSPGAFADSRAAPAAASPTSPG